MTGWYNSDSWMDIVDHLLLVLGVLSVAVATAAVPVWISNHKATKTELAKNAKTLEAIRYQVENDHPDSNLRESIDELRDLLKEQGQDIRGIRKDMGEMRGEARDDRGNLRELEQRIQDFVKREHPGAGPL